LTLLPIVVRLSNVFAQTLNKILFCLLWLSTSVCLFIVTQLEKENFFCLRFTKNFSSKKLYRSTFVMRLKIIVHSFAKWNNHKIIITLKKTMKWKCFNINKSTFLKRSASKCNDQALFLFKKWSRKFLIRGIIVTRNFCLKMSFLGYFLSS
jgi:hypothetical protein